MGKQHKHLRAQKVYDESEYYFNDNTSYMPYFIDQFSEITYYEEDYYGDEETDWYLSELGLDYLRSDFDWSDYVDETGKVLESWEIRNKEVEESTRAWSCEYGGQVVCDCDVWEV